MAETVPEINRPETTVDKEGAIPAPIPSRVPHEPAAKVETIVQGVDLGLPARIDSNRVVQFTGTEEGGDSHRRHTGRPVDWIVPGDVQSDLDVGISLLDVGQDATMDRPGTVIRVECVTRFNDEARRKDADGGLEIVNRQPDLFEMVATGASAGRIAARQYGRQQQRHQQTDQPDDDQQLDERETSETTAGRGHKNFHRKGTTNIMTQETEVWGRQHNRNDARQPGTSGGGRR